MSDSKTRVDYAAVGKTMGNAALIGAGTAAAIALARQMLWLKERSKPLKETLLDDDTIYIKIPNLKKEGATGKVTPVSKSDTLALQIVGGALSGILGWTGTNTLVSKLRQKQLKQELDDVQVIHIDKLKRMKELTKVSNFLETSWGTAKGVGALTALASAVVTHALLKQYLKDPKPVNKENLQRVKFIREAPSAKLDVSDDEDEDVVKLASIELDTTTITNFLRLNLELAEKRAVHSDLVNLVRTTHNSSDVAAGAVKQASFVDAMEYISSVVPSTADALTPMQKFAACARIAETPGLCDLAVFAAAQEYLDATKNGLSKIAAHILATDPVTSNGLIEFYKKFAAMEKEAFFDPVAAMSLLRSLRNQQDTFDEEAPAEASHVQPMFTSEAEMRDAADDEDEEQGSKLVDSSISNASLSDSGVIDETDAFIDDAKASVAAALTNHKID